MVIQVIQIWVLKSLISNVQKFNLVHCSSTQTIGQAYEEMQTQNSRLLHQITERDDYNTQVLGVSLVHNLGYLVTSAGQASFSGFQLLITIWSVSFIFAVGSK